MKRSFCIVILFAFSIVTSSAIDCNNNKCIKRGFEHTLCTFMNRNPSVACGRVLSMGLSDDEKKEIVNAHNKRRSFVAKGLEKRGNPGPQPAASNMEDIVWDDELSEIAQRWANQCTFDHDQCRDVDRFYVGQNAGMTMSAGNLDTKLSEIIDSWYEEVKDMDRNQISSFANIGNVGHYTQMIWATTNRIGCGKIVYQVDFWKRNFLVCNYGPGGNILKQPVYLIKE